MAGPAPPGTCSLNAFLTCIAACAAIRATVGELPVSEPTLPLTRPVASTASPEISEIICSTGPPGKHLNNSEVDQNDHEQRRWDEQQAANEYMQTWYEFTGPSGGASLVIIFYGHGINNGSAFSWDRPTRKGTGCRLHGVIVGFAQIYPNTQCGRTRHGNAGSRNGPTADTRSRARARGHRGLCGLGAAISFFDQRVDRWVFNADDIAAAIAGRAAALPQESRCSLPGDMDCPQLPTIDVVVECIQAASILCGSQPVRACVSLHAELFKIL